MVFGDDCGACGRYWRLTTWTLKKIWSSWCLVLIQGPDLHSNAESPYSSHPFWCLWRRLRRLWSSLGLIPWALNLSLSILFFLVVCCTLISEQTPIRKKKKSPAEVITVWDGSLVFLISFIFLSFIFFYSFDIFCLRWRFDLIFAFAFTLIFYFDFMWWKHISLIPIQIEGFSHRVSFHLDTQPVEHVKLSIGDLLFVKPGAFPMWFSPSLILTMLYLIPTHYCNNVNSRHSFQLWGFPHAVWFRLVLTRPPIQNQNDIGGIRGQMKHGRPDMACGGREWNLGILENLLKNLRNWWDRWKDRASQLYHMMSLYSRRWLVYTTLPSKTNQTKTKTNHLWTEGYLGGNRQNHGIEGETAHHNHTIGQDQTKTQKPTQELEYQSNGRPKLQKNCSKANPRTSKWAWQTCHHKGLQETKWPKCPFNAPNKTNKKISKTLKNIIFDLKTCIKKPQKSIPKLENKNRNTKTNQKWSNDQKKKFIQHTDSITIFKTKSWWRKFKESKGETGFNFVRGTLSNWLYLSQRVFLRLVLTRPRMHVGGRLWFILFCIEFWTEVAE